jgi:PIN domain nuclease of toxin-antitoxin system
MKLLLDTHAWLWWQMAPERLSKAALAALGAEENDVFLSAVSSWEMAIKIAAGRLQLPRALSEMVPESLMQDGFINLPIQPAHCFALSELPMHHRDPFDRMLVAQALAEDCTLVSADSVLDRYASPRLAAARK